MKVGILMGGTSSEREVSLMTGKEFINNIEKNSYDIVPVELDGGNDVINKLKELDFALLALHGGTGEDGRIQSLLEALQIPYSGSGVLSSALCMNKALAKKLIKAEGLKTPDWHLLKATDALNHEFLSSLKYPIVVKPNSGGSSIGVSIVRTPQELQNAINNVVNFDSEIMLEEYADGEEITCCILNNALLPIVSIKPKAEFFDYNSKYEDGGSIEEIIKLSPDVAGKVEAAALKCYEIFNCSVYARVDIILMQGEPFILEVNTLPGMTRNSLFPKSAAAAGISFPKLLDLVIQYSLQETR